MASLPTTPIAAGVKTPGSGVYSDPAQVGAMIQKMYPQYANFDPTTLGQRWIDVHTPQGTGTASSADVLQGPTGTTPLTSTDPNQQAPDLSGLAQFASPMQQPLRNTLPGTGTMQSNTDSPSATMSAPKPKPTTPSYPGFSPSSPSKNSLLNSNKLKLTL